MESTRSRAGFKLAGALAACSLFGGLTCGQVCSPWSVAATPSGRLSDVVWTGQGYVAVGAGGLVMTSSDGGDWVTQTVRTSADITRVLATESGPVAFSSAGEVLMSSDGSDWTLKEGASLPPLGDGLTGLACCVTYGRGTFLAFGPYRAFRSSDLRSWESTYYPVFGIATAVWTGRDFLVAGQWPYLIGMGGPIGATSPDGISWTRVEVPNSSVPAFFRSLTANATTWLESDWSVTWLSSDGGSSWRTVNPGGPVAASSWSGPRFLAAGAGAWAGESWDGLTWTTQALPIDAAPAAIAGGPGHAVIVGDAILRAPCTGSAESITIPAAAHNPGFNGTLWRTDLTVANRGTTPAVFTVSLLPWNQPNPAPATATFALPPGVMIRFPDVVGSVFAATGGATLRVAATQGRVIANARTYTQGPGGTLGQFMPGLTSADALTTGASGTLIGLSQSLDRSAGFRTNLGLVNDSPGPVTVDADFYRSDGALLGTRSYPLRGFESLQRNAAFEEVTSADVADGCIVVHSVTPNARFLAYASVVDNVSGSPVYVPALWTGPVQPD